ncbi:MAG TPA: zf-HC2 domain-containing protein [Burkholderiales bacterium]|nr:zf-HC2 domain-containing protein [Burkholderiales bacterium]
MDCRNFALRVDDWLDGRLGAAEQEPLRLHLQSCEGCRRGHADAESLRAEMRKLAAPAMRPGFAAQALAKAVAAPAGAAPAMALAASLALGVGVAAILFAVRPEPAPTVSLSVQQPESIHLVFNSAKALQGATLSLWLPENVQIVGYGDRRELTWSTDLREGANLLQLPLVLQARANGEFVAVLSHGESSKRFRLKIEARPQG